MAVIVQRIRRVASMAGERRLADVDELFRTRPHVARSLIEHADPLAMAEAAAELVDGLGIEADAHSRRLVGWMELLAGALDVDDRTRAGWQLGALVHDIGKLGIEDDILSSPQVLGPRELDLIRMHSSLGHAILFGLPAFDIVAGLVLSHHEYWDGSGYHGQRGPAIPLAARAFAIADSYDAPGDFGDRSLVCPTARGWTSRPNIPTYCRNRTDRRPGSTTAHCAKPAATARSTARTTSP